MHSSRSFANAWGLECRMLGDLRPDQTFGGRKTLKAMKFWFSSSYLHLFSRIFSVINEAFGKWLRGNHSGENHACFPFLQLFPTPIFKLHSAYFQHFLLVCNSSGLAAALLCSAFQEGRGQKHRHVSKKTDKVLWFHWLRKWVSHTLKDWYPWLVLLVQTNTRLC